MAARPDCQERDRASPPEQNFEHELASDVSEKEQSRAGEHPAQTLIRRGEPVYQSLHKEISSVRLIGRTADDRAERIDLLLFCHSKIIWREVREPIRLQ